MPSSTRTAEARVEWSNGKYRRLARNVICPASACSIPATPRISSSGGPSKRHPNFCATSASFMKGLLNSFWAVCESRTGQRGKYSRAVGLFVEKAGLRSRGSSGGRLPARDAHDPENGHFREGGTRNKDTVRGRVQVRRCDLQPVIQQRQQVVRHNAFLRFSVIVTQLHP